MSMEIELKLAVEEISADVLSQHPLVRRYASGECEMLRVENSYYDTPDLLLQKSGFALRLRRSGDRWLQTVKSCGNSAAGFHQRSEWEMPVSGNSLELKRFDDPRLRELLDDHKVKKSLAPLFRTDSNRTIWLLETADESRIELVLDQGEITSGSKTETISEIELELQAGKPAGLLQAALALARDLPLHLLNTSKSERGYILGGFSSPVGVRKSKSPKLKKRWSAEDAFVFIMRWAVEQLQTNEEILTRSPENTEGVHKIRVATRRMRSCLRLYRPLIPRQLSQQIDDRIKRITTALGPARDWDVFIDETLHPMARSFPHHEMLQKLLTLSQQQRAAAYRAATAEVGSKEHTCTLLGLALWLELRSWREYMHKGQLAALDQPVHDFACGVLEKCHHRVMRRGDEFAHLDAAQRHRLRIRCKRLRYSAEFFSALYGRKRSRSYLHSLARMQDVLGVLNDERMVEQLLKQVAVEGDAPAADLVRGWTAANTGAHLRQFDMVWKSFVRRSPFWRSKCGNS